ncbi:uridine 5'-monophosphate synthase [Trichonephila clavata]|uniref:Uridine 5'-monophosphate synthase n=1 Tax=Trichonephila clavata TaxID=2740835 RepID=A0A8X6H1H3_TRICU|nr:uridine 5'-monophosphate synthase [Trichonephila clavata]
MSKREDLLRQLLGINILQLGQFTLKSGVISPIYIDLRRIISYPDIVKLLAEHVHSKLKEAGIATDVICGVPYTALPVASVYSVLYQVPMVMKRKEAKDYGTKKMVEGITEKGLKCLIIEDIVTSGSSVNETAEVLRQEGLIVTDCVVVLDRLQGGEQNLDSAGIKLHSLFNMDDIFNSYCSLHQVPENIVQDVKHFLADNSHINIKKETVYKRLSFEERAEICKQPVAKKLFNIIAEKKSNLCVAVDVTDSEKLLELASKLGPFICMLKTHMDILSDFSVNVLTVLKNLAKTHNFLIFEDRKFADIGNTVVNQYNGGIFKINDWADIVTVHGIPGDGIIEALKSASDGKERSCVLIAEMSSKGALTDDSYRNNILKMAGNHKDFVIGFVSQHVVVKNQEYIHMFPGVHINESGDSLGQQYNSPEKAISNGADVVIVGRGICSSLNVVEAVQDYKDRSYKAYMNVIKRPE